MEIFSNQFAEKHVIDIAAFFPNGSSSVLTLLPDDTYVELEDRVEITFQSPWVDLPANKMVLYKAHLVGFTVQHRMQKYQVEPRPTQSGVSPQSYNTTPTASESR